MGAKSKIDWTDATWNPVRGCTKVSTGCKNCYAERLAARFCGEGQPYYGTITNGKWNGALRVVEHKALTQPIRWRRQRKIFVNSMSDLFHEGMDDRFIDEIYAVMLICAHHERPRGHIFQVLTKRAKRMHDYLSNPELHKRLAVAAGELMEDGDRWHDQFYYNLNGVVAHPSIWIGVTVENQDVAHERMPALIATPAAVKFVSCEPLLGCMSLAQWMRHIDWVIAGCESGPGRRLAETEWFRVLRDQCRPHGVPFFIKQMENDFTYRVEKLPELDGVQWAQFPDENWE